MGKNKRVYKLVSSDGHLNEPADVWTSRVAKKNRDRVPVSELWWMPGRSWPTEIIVQKNQRHSVRLLWAGRPHGDDADLRLHSR